jgi:hypothetical protein
MKEMMRSAMGDSDPATIAECKVFSDPECTPLILKEGWCLISGGDTVDKGEASLRIPEEIFRIKRSSPDRVCLIMGNRDANKLRVRSELLPYQIDKRDLSHVFPPEDYTPWRKFKKPDTYGAWKQNPDNGFGGDEAWARLMWMLSKSMGAGQVAEFLAKELPIVFNDESQDGEPGPVLNRLCHQCSCAPQAFLSQMVQSGLPITEPNKARCVVYEAFRLAIGRTEADAPLNGLLRYLQAGQLVAYLPTGGADGIDGLEGTLFAHGLVDFNNAGRVPDAMAETYSDATKRLEPEVWVEEMNRWAQSQVAAATGPTSPKCTKQGGCPKPLTVQGTSTRGGDALMDFALERMGSGRLREKESPADIQDGEVESTIYGRSATPMGTNKLKDMFEGFDGVFQEDSSWRRLQNILVGHTPRGPIHDVNVNARGQASLNADTSCQGGRNAGELVHHGSQPGLGSLVIVKIDGDITVYGKALETPKGPTYDHAFNLRSDEGVLAAFQNREEKCQSNGVDVVNPSLGGDTKSVIRSVKADGTAVCLSPKKYAFLTAFGAPVASSLVSPTTESSMSDGSTLARFSARPNNPGEAAQELWGPTPDDIDILM